MLDNLSKTLPYIVLLLVSIVIAIKRRNRTIEKEKAWTVLKRTRSSALFISGILSVILLYADFRVYPALDNVYKAFNLPPPALLEVAPYITFLAIVVILVLALYIYFSKSIDKEFKENLKKYQDGERVKIHNLVGKKLHFLFLSIIIFPAIVSFVLVIPPLTPDNLMFAAVPKNYSDCMRTENKYNFQNRNRSMLACSYTVFPEKIPHIDPEAVDKNKYDECVKEKGYPYSYGGDCSLLFYNPEYAFPQNFRECVDEKKGEFTTSVRPRCIIDINASRAANADVANDLINKCITLSGDYSEEFGHRCYMEFDESDL